MMHGQQNIKFVSAQKAKQMYQYKNTKEKLRKTNTAIWFDKASKCKQLTPNYISTKIKDNNPQCWKTIKAAPLYGQIF
jgi:hypothetical protein